MESPSDLWYKNAVIYCIDVKTFQDSNGDGIGDFPGLTSRVDYLAGLGVTTVWLLPFFPSPWRDNGYDVADYYNVDPRLGTLGDVEECIRAARDRGIRILTDLVFAHTSDQHPWFVASRSSRESPYRDYYIWVDTPPEDSPRDLTFPGEEDSNWRYDAHTGQYYYHRFYHFEPKLNPDHPDIEHEFAKIASFWLSVGLSGFRIDAAPFVIEQAALPGPHAKDPQALLRHLRGVVSRRRGDAILLGEANVTADQLDAYFGEHGDELELLFGFLVNQGLVLALARQRAEPLARMLEQLPATPAISQFVNFARNQDELSLDKLSDAERNEVFAAFAPDPGMRIYGRGIRRRLASMLNGDQPRLELAYSLMFTLPGTPALLYGEEIGMGDDLAVPGRGSVRTVMQWTPEPNAGFSSPATDPASFHAPLVADGPSGYQRVNVADQRRDVHSLLNVMQRLIRTRKETPEFGFGSWRLLATDQPAVLAHEARWQGGRVLAVHNLGPAPCQVTIQFDDEGAGGLVEDVLGGRDDTPLRRGALRRIPLAGYGYRWLRMAHRRTVSG
jgi:maltose alpha-D-glucosyltransferase / alpha-amylase